MVSQDLVAVLSRGALCPKQAIQLATRSVDAFYVRGTLTQIPIQAAVSFDCKCVKNENPLIATGKNQLSEDDTMRLYTALEALPAGERLEYTNGEGTTVVF